MPEDRNPDASINNANNTLGINPQLRMSKAKQALANFLSNGVLSPISRLPTQRQEAELLAYGKKVRDRMVWSEPTLSAATYIYQQLSSSRDWFVSGKIKPAARAVDCLHETRIRNITTGALDYGLENAIKRRSLDNVAVGRTAYLNRIIPGEKTTRLEYLDPTELRFSRQRDTNLEVLPSEKVWSYAGTKEAFRDDQVFLNHAIPYGANGMFMAPLFSLMPTVALAYLVSEHDTSSLDGRRIRDLVLTANDNVQAAIIDAIVTQVALFAGEDPADVGIPVASLNSPSGVKLEELVATLELSRLPKDFNREQFMFMYVNMIAGLLGLALRHFWNNERTTNRALEEIQEQRQQQKGPAEFVNNEQRIINRTGVLNQFGGKVRFGFIEEVDSQSQLINAQVLKTTSEALEKFVMVFGTSLSPQAVLSWMQSIHVIPNELELIEGGAEQGLNNPNQPGMGENTVEGNPSPSALNSEKSRKQIVWRSNQKAMPMLDYDEVMIDSKGMVIDHRPKIFSAAKIIQDMAEQEDAQRAADPNEQIKSFEAVIEEEERELVEQFVAHMRKGKALETDVAELFFSPEIVSEAITRANSDAQSLTADDFVILATLMGGTAEVETDEESDTDT